MDIIYIKKLVQLHVIDGSYKELIDKYVNEFVEFNCLYNEEHDLINMIFKFKTLKITDILMLFDYTRYLHFPNFINQLGKVYYECGINATSQQSNLPYPMFCFTRASDMIQKLLLTTNIDNELRLKILYDHKDTFKSVCQGYNYYQYIDYTINNKTDSKIILTITSCKRLELFIRTVQSFLVCCTDNNLIHKWVCIDDNSSDTDRIEMQRMFPWIDYIFKDETQKGHAKSMNILRKYVKDKYDPDYILHLEDDWKFITKYNFITHALNVLQAENVGQCLFNMNYAETEEDSIRGGILKCINGTFYLEHEYLIPSDKNKQASYWPHFSMRPGLLRAEIWNEEFPENSNHFEIEFAYKYITNNWITTFLPSITCVHTGKLTYENGSNAYTMNNETQFKSKEKLELQYVYFENFDNYKKVLKRLKRLRQKNWFCTTQNEIQSINTQNYMNYIINVSLYSMNWDIIFIVKNCGNEQSTILLNKTEYIVKDNIIAFIVSSSNIPLLIDIDDLYNISKKLNIIICKSID